MTSPYVLIIRDPETEAKVLKYISLLVDVKNCFICGHSEATISPEKEQTNFFKKYVNPQKKKNDNNSNTCSDCFPLVTQMWTIHQQIRALQADLQKVVDAANNKSKKEETKVDFVADIQIKEENQDDMFMPDFSADSDVEMGFCDEELDNFKDLILVPDSVIEPKIEIETRRRPSRKSKIKAEQLLKSVIINTKVENSDNEEEEEEETVQFKNEVESESDCDYDGEESSQSEPEDDEDFEIPSSSLPVKNIKEKECDICSKTFSTRSNLMEHIRFVHNKERNHKCPKKGCLRRFKKKSLLKNHLVKFHKEGRSIGTRKGEKVECEICSKLMDAKSLNEHIRFIHNKERNFFCPKPGCGISFGKRYKYEVHLKLHDKPKKPPKNASRKTINCSKCSKGFTKKKTWILHQIQVCNVEVSEEELKLYEFLQCPSCPLQFENKGKLERHDRLKHEGLNTTKLICSKGCGKTFSENYHRLLHEATICGNSTIEEFRKQYALDNKRLKCPSCPKRFIHQKSLDTHILTHGDGNDEDLEGNTVKCDICDKVLSRNTLTMHKARVHKNKGKVRMNCEFCGKGFYYAQDMTTHIRRVHQDVNNCQGIDSSFAEVICDECGKKVKGQNSLAKHKARVHLKEKNFICCTCGWKFFCATDVRRHERRVHAPKETFDCTKCGTKFQLQFALQKHQKTKPNCNDGTYKYRKSATDDKPQPCVTCGEHFTRKSHLNKHMMDNHPDLWDWEKRKSKVGLVTKNDEKVFQEPQELEVEFILSI